MWLDHHSLSIKIWSNREAVLWLGSPACCTINLVLLVAVFSYFISDGGLPLTVCGPSSICTISAPPRTLLPTFYTWPALTSFVILFLRCLRLHLLTGLSLAIVDFHSEVVWYYIEVSGLTWPTVCRRTYCALLLYRLPTFLLIFP